MRYPIKLVPQGIIPRDPNMTIRMERVPAESTSAAVDPTKAVRITKTADQQRPIIGSNITFALTVKNIGTTTAHSVAVTDVLSDAYLLVSSTPSVGTYVDGIWTVGELAAGATETLEIVATVLPSATSYANSASVAFTVTGQQHVSSTEIGDEPTPTLPAGSDVWYDSPSASVIPFAAYDGAVSELTDATTFGTDDDINSESDLPGLSVAPLASAWWQLTVPAGVSDVLLTVDTWLTTHGRVHWTGTGAPLYPGDTNISVWLSDESPPLGALPTAGTDFGSLTLVASSDDNPDPSDPSREFTSKLEDVSLGAGAVYWIRVDTWGGDTDPGSMYADGIIYRIRVSLSYTTLA